MLKHKSDLFDEISTHDLVQPLTAIRLQAELVARQIETGRASLDDAIAALDAIAERAGALADTLAAQLSNEVAPSSLRRTHCDLAAIVYTTVAAFDPSGRDRVIVRAYESVEG